jgi:hypothetical protein
MRVRQTPSFKYRPLQPVGYQAQEKLTPRTRSSAGFEPGKGEMFSASGSAVINLTHSESCAHRNTTTTSTHGEP